jgi:hypothetical protein
VQGTNKHSSDSSPSLNAPPKARGGASKPKAEDKPEKPRVYIIGHDMGYAKRRVATKSGQWWQWDRDGKMTKIDEPGRVSEYKAGRWW